MLHRRLSIGELCAEFRQRIRQCVAQTVLSCREGIGGGFGAGNDADPILLRQGVEEIGARVVDLIHDWNNQGGVQTVDRREDEHSSDDDDDDQGRQQAEDAYEGAQ